MISGQVEINKSTQIRLILEQEFLYGLLPKFRVRILEQSYYLPGFSFGIRNFLNKILKKTIEI